MIRTAVALSLAISSAGLSSAEVVSPPPQQGALSARPHPRILGTLDPATGVFRPDADPPGYTEIRGQVNLVFDLDATNLDSVSIVCNAIIAYVGVLNDGSTKGFGVLDAEQLYPKFHDKKFLGTLPADFTALIPNDRDAVARITVICVYANDPGTQAFRSDFHIPLHSGSVDVGIGGVMNGIVY